MGKKTDAVSSIDGSFLIIFTWNNHFFGFDFKGYKQMPNEAFPRVASTLGHITEKGCTLASIYLICSGYFIDCLFVVSDLFHVCIMSD